ncbi:MAG TPA: di-heme oxidoredictase family protein [Methylocella sp.]|nr:di-heme oxidoredictase family protein [Methylocella sp.]
MTFFNAGSANFQEAETIAGDNGGLGPRFNLDRCSGCHSQPAVGGSSPGVNPQPSIAKAYGARNTVPLFVKPNGPIVEARFKYFPDGSLDGGVHSLFVISGRVDSSGNASDCTAVQENFNAQYANNNISLRIPIQLFGDGLVEAITDSTILANLAANQAAKSQLGIGGHPNRSANTGTITRFGWKAQNQSLLMFAGEAYNVEMGISNELFQNERDDNPTCQYAPVPNDSTVVDGSTGLPASQAVSDIERFAFFMKFLAPPSPSQNTPGGATSIGHGQQLFANVGCSLCHTPSLQTSTVSEFAGLSNVTVNLFSDLAVHRMGRNLADDIVQGNAQGDEFRTAPLWGLGQRIFFLHDGRTSDLVQAIYAHSSVGDSHYSNSEANQVIAAFDSLSESDKQDLLNFLRSF